MAYSPNSTFVTFPNGDVQDVTGCGMLIQGGMFKLVKQGQTIYQFPFASIGDAASTRNTIQQNLSALNLNNLESYEWSVDGANWNIGAIPVNAAPLYLQLFGMNLSSASSATLIDAAGTSFGLQVSSASMTSCITAAFSQPGSNNVAPGNALLLLSNPSGSVIGSVVVAFASAQSASVVWSPDGISFNPMPVPDNINFYLELSGMNFPYMRIDHVSSPQIGGHVYTASFSTLSPTVLETTIFNTSGATIPTGSYTFTVFDSLNNVLFVFIVNFA